MKRVILSSIERDYEIFVYPRRGKGEYGATILQSWVLNAPNKSEAVSFGYEVLGGLSLDEIFEDKKTKFREVYDSLLETYAIDELDPIGMDIAKRAFTVRTDLR